MNLIAEVLSKLEIPRSNNVYFPSNDSFLFLDYLDTVEFTSNINSTLKKLYEKNPNGDFTILDMGSGAGILGFCLAYKLLAESCENHVKTLKIVFVDINLKAVELTKRFVQTNLFLLKNLKIKRNFSDFVKFSFVTSDLFQYLSTENYFNICVFNPPYLPHEDEINENSKKDIDYAWNGGDDSGNKTLLRFFSVLKNYAHPLSEIYFITSSLSDTSELLERILQYGYSSVLLQSTHIFFEDIILFKSYRKLI